MSLSHEVPPFAAALLLCLLALFIGNYGIHATATQLAALPPPGLNKLCAARFIQGAADCEYLLQSQPLYHTVQGFSRGAVAIDVFPVSGLPAFETVVNLPAQIGGGQLVRDTRTGDVELAINNFTLGTVPSSRKTYVRYKQDSVYTDVLNNVAKTFPEEITFAIPAHLAGQLELAGDSIVAPNNFVYARYQNSDDQFTPLSLGLELGNMPSQCIGTFTINDVAIPMANDAILLDMNCDDSVTQAENIYGCALKQRRFRDVALRNFSAEASPVFENQLISAINTEESAFENAGTTFWSAKYPPQYSTLATIGKGIPRRDLGGAAPVWATVTYRHPTACLDPNAFGTNGPNSLQFVWTQGIDVEDQDVAETALPALIRHRVGDFLHSRIVYVPFLQGRPKIVRPFNSGVLTPRVTTRGFCRSVAASTDSTADRRATNPPQNYPSDQLFHLASVTGLPYSNVVMFARFDFDYPYNTTLSFSTPNLWLKRGEAVQFTGVRANLNGMTHSAMVYYNGPLVDSPRTLLYEESTIGGENACNCVPSPATPRCALTPTLCPIIPAQPDNIYCTALPRDAIVNTPFKVAEAVDLSQDVTIPSCSIILLNGFDKTAGALIDTGIVGSSDTVLVNGTYTFEVHTYPDTTPATVRWSVDRLSQLQYSFSSPVATTAFTSLPVVDFSLFAVVPYIVMNAQVLQNGQVGSCSLQLDVDLGAPVAVLLPRRYVMTPSEAVTLLGNYSYQATGEALTWSWRITSATVRNAGFIQTTGNQSVITFTSALTGTFKVTMTVKNSRDIERSASASIIVQATPINRTALLSQTMCATSIQIDPSLQAPTAVITDPPTTWGPVNTAPDVGVRYKQPGESYLQTQSPNIFMAPGDIRRSPSVPDPESRERLLGMLAGFVIAATVITVLFFLYQVLANLVRHVRAQTVRRRVAS